MATKEPIKGLANRKLFIEAKKKTNEHFNAGKNIVVKTWFVIDFKKYLYLIYAHYLRKVLNTLPQLGIDGVTSYVFLTTRLPVNASFAGRGT